ncbi:hypothetical protein [Virgisporangium aliadipatigenens]|nr:hypothetical protein [Virgisporangium aliadipatigenens]
MAADGTVEWGDDGRPRLFDRVLNDPEPTGAGPNYPALVAAAVAVVLLVAAEFQPWVTLTGSEDSVREIRGGARPEIYLAELASSAWQLLPYYVGWMGMLGLVGLALTLGPARRRPVLGAGVGWAVGLFMVVLSFGRQLSLMRFGDNPLIGTSLGAGLWFAGGAVLLALAALLLTAWRPDVPWPSRKGGRAPRPDPVEDDGPPDLTVTPLS